MATRPPRARAFASDGAEAVFNAFLALSQAVQFNVLDSIHERLAVPDPARSSHPRRVSEALRGLHEAHESLGESPSVRMYTRLRAEHPEFGWPAVASLKRWLGVGSWDDALRLAALPAAARDGDALEVELGPSFSKEEVTLALRECKAELGRIPSFNEYYSWAHRHDVRRRDGRRPLSQTPFARLFGSYPDALIAAGLLTSQHDAVVSRGGRLRAASYRVGSGRILEAAREVADRLGRSPRVTEYMNAREEIYSETNALGRPRALPAYGTIARHFPHWNEMLLEAGLEPVAGREVRVAGHSWGGSRFSGVQIRSALRRAHDAVGEPFTQRAYEGWRHAEITANPDHAPQVPSANAIGRHFGRWNAARASIADEASEAK